MNDDGEVNVVDALLVAQAYDGIKGEPVHLLTADVNGDLMADIFDALMIAQYYVGLIPKFKAESDGYDFKDTAVEAIVRKALGKRSSERVSFWDLRTLSSLQVEGLNGVNISDAEYMLGLNEISLSNCSNIDLDLVAEIVDELAYSQLPINPMNAQISMKYPYLTRLNLNNTECGDIQALSILTNLTELDLTNTGLADLSSLEEMREMRTLNVSRNEVNSLAPIQNMLSLINLNLSHNKVNDAGFSAMGNLESLLNLNINRNEITDVGVLDNHPNLITADIRVNPLKNILSYPKRIRRVLWFSCFPGGYKGDANGDGEITREDVDMVRAVTNVEQWYAFPDEIGCIDMNSDGLLDGGDVVELVQTGEKSVYGIPGSSVCIKGDVDGDGTVTLDDADLLESFSKGAVRATSDFRCVDMDNNGAFDPRKESGIIKEQVLANEPVQVISEPKKNGITVLTYDYNLQQWGKVTSLDVPKDNKVTAKDAAGIMPDGAIEDMHKRIVTNPFLGHADIVLMPEYAYADANAPIELDDNGIGAHPRFEISNNNWITDKVHELLSLAAEHQVNIVVPIIEKLFYDVGVPFIINGALVININGEIEYVRRKTHAVLTPGYWESTMPFWKDISDSSHVVMELKTRNRDTFTSVLVICAEMSTNIDPVIQDVINDHINAPGGKTIDLLLFSEISPKGHQYVDIQNRIQYGAWDPEIRIEAVNDANDYIGLVDFLAYSGGVSSNLGVFSMTGTTVMPKPEKIDFTYTHQFDNNGYVFSRFILKRPE